MVFIPPFARSLAGFMKYTDGRTKVGSFSKNMADASTSTGYTGVGFKPKAIIFLAVVDGSTKYSFGYSDGTSNFGYGGYGDSTILASNGASAITIRNSAGNSTGGVVASFDADGFTITYTKSGSPTGTADIYYMAFR